MKIKDLNQIQESKSIDEIDEGLKDIASKFGKSIADRVSGRGPDKEQRKSTKEREKRIDSTAKKAYHAWKDYEDHVAQSMAADDDRHDDFLNKGPEWQEYFRRWIAKNLLPDGLPIEAMSNARDIEAAVRKLSGGGAETFRPAEISQDQLDARARDKASRGAPSAPESPQPDITKPTPAPTQTATAPGGKFGDYRDVEDLAYDVGMEKMTPAQAQAEYEKRQRSRFPEPPPREEPEAELEPEEPTSRFPEPPESTEEPEPEPEAPTSRFPEPAKQPLLQDPNVYGDITRVQKAVGEGDFTILQIGKQKFSFDPDDENYPPQWNRVDLARQQPVNPTINNQLNKAYDMFLANDDIIDQPSQSVSTARTTSDTSAPPHPTHERPPERLLPGQTRNAPSPEQARAEKEQYQQELERQRVAGREALAAAERAREEQDAAARAAGEEPPSRGLIRKPGSTGRGMQAEFEPIKEALRRRVRSGEITLAEAKVIYARKKQIVSEAMDEKIERDLFKTLVRAASLAEPTEGGPEPTGSGTGQTGGDRSPRSLGGSTSRSSGGSLVNDLLQQQGLSHPSGSGGGYGDYHGDVEEPDMLQGLTLDHMSKDELRDYILRGMPQYHTFADMGAFFRQAYGLQSNKIRSTGNKTVDTLLTKMGFSVQ